VTSRRYTLISDMKKASQEKLRFSGFISPRYTQVPDELFDDLMSHLSGAELKVLLYIIRRTFGFKKDVDNISLNQICKGITTRDGEVLDKGTGLSQQSVITALKGLLEKNAIVAKRRSSKEKGYESTTYSLHLIPFSNNLMTPSPKMREALLQKVEIQETVIQQTDLQHRNSNSKLLSNGSNRDKEHTEFKAMGDLLKNRFTKKTIDLKEIPDSLKITIDEISSEFGEKRNLRSNLTHVVRILQRSGKSPQNFTSYLYEARSITKQQGSVKKQMPYFFRVLEDIVGIQK
jgi:phage replication O-like protein O